MKNMLVNPILPGFYPDPSIIRVEDDFYMITSSFSMFPGIPIFHSRDLAHWEQIGNVLDRKSQLHVTADMLTAGIMAPTLRYHDGVYYVINTNVSDRWNFVVTAENPAGPWSEPHWIPDCEGIDPSLFFDEDGTVYFTGTRHSPEPEGGQEIWASEFDLKNMCLVGPRVGIWRGALTGAASPEAPHLYKKDGWYYLMIAEGGTEHFHAVTIARSRSVLSAFQGYVGNPIMTHRHLGKNYPICNVGHADLVELKNGDWYAVMLASRLIDGYHKNLGRETFIAPVTWEDGWPVFSPGTGKLEWSYPAPELPAFEVKPGMEREDFNRDKLPMEWVFLGTPYEDFYKLEDSKLQLKLLPREMAPELKPVGVVWDSKELAFVGRRQLHESFSLAVQMEFNAQAEYETAGLAIVQASNHQLRLERTMKDGKQLLRLVLCTSEMKGLPWLPGFESKTTERVLAQAQVSDDDESMCLKVVAHRQDHSFYYGKDEHSLVPLCEHVDGGLINPEIVGGMVGTILGVFGSSNGQVSENHACFDWFEYKEIIKED